MSQLIFRKSTLLGVVLSLFIAIGIYFVFAKPPVAKSSTSTWVWPLEGGVPIRGSLFGTTVENTEFGVKNLDLVHPVPYKMTCFGVGFHEPFHAGVDLYVPDLNGNNTAYGDAVRAISDGIVTLKKDKFDDGWTIVIDHSQYTQDNVFSAYWHLTNIPANVIENQPVIGGQIIGYVRARTYTGRFPSVHPFLDDAHIHFEIRTDGDLHDSFPGTACNDLNWKEGVGYTFPYSPETYGFLDPIAFLNERITNSILHLPIVSNGQGTVCQPNQNLLNNQNPGFEGSTASPEPWIEISTYFDPAPNVHYYYHIVEDDAYNAYSGNHSAFFGNQVFFALPVDEQLLQSIVIPKNTETLTWQAYVKLNRDYTGNLDDNFTLSLRDASTGVSLAEDVVIDFGFPDPQLDGNWLMVTVEYDHVASLAGRQVSLSYTGFADGDVHASTLRVDDVQLRTTACNPNPQGGQIVVDVTTQITGGTPTPTLVPPTPTPTNTPVPTATPTLTPTPTATPPGDQYEPNNHYYQTSPLSSIVIGTTQTRDATISTTYDEDWFEFHVPNNANCPSGICSIQATLSNIPSSTNYELALYGDNPNTHLTISDNPSNQSETLHYNFELDTVNGDTFRLRIFSSIGANYQQNYHLTLVVNDFSILAYEPNDKFTDAYNLSFSPGQATEIVAALYPTTDEDWFKLYLNPSSSIPPVNGQLLTLWLDNPTGGDYELALYDEAGHLLSLSAQAGDTPEYISYQISQLGWYYIRLYPSPSSEALVAEPYQLSILFQP